MEKKEIYIRFLQPFVTFFGDGENTWPELKGWNVYLQLGKTKGHRLNQLVYVHLKSKSDRSDSTILTWRDHCLYSFHQQIQEDDYFSGRLDL